MIDQQRGLLPDEFANYYLLDRVLNVGSNSCVPFGLRGMVTGIILGGKSAERSLRFIFFKYTLTFIVLLLVP